MISIDCISDLHGHRPKLPGGDLLIMAGDYTAHDSLEEINEFEKWMGNLNYKKIIYISGNHDNIYATRESSFGEKIEFLFDQSTTYTKPNTIHSLNIYGTPWTAWFPGVNPKYTASMRPEDHLSDKFNHIPEDLDILICHGPPYGILDENDYRVHCGSIALMRAIERAQPKYVIFGHIHEQGGKRLTLKNVTSPIGMHAWDINFLNVSYLDQNYRHWDHPIRRIELVFPEDSRHFNENYLNHPEI